MSINWDNGNRTELKTGETLTCHSLNPGQLYAMYFYNDNYNDRDVQVTVVWSNSAPPNTVTVPGTTGDAGFASLVLVSGDDTQVVAASITNSTREAHLDCWLCSVEMPINDPRLINGELPSDGRPHQFGGYRRYYKVLPTSWSQITLESMATEFILAQFQENFVTILVANPIQNVPHRIVPIGTVAPTQYKIVQPKPGEPAQRITYPIQGDGTQLVWMSADSLKNPGKATINLQSLEELYSAYRPAEKAGRL